MSCVLLNTAYFPCISYMARMANSSLVKIETHENYIRQTGRSRTEILTSSGPLLLTVPVKKTSDKILITEAEIDNTKPWSIRHVRAIRTAYGSAPYFGHYSDEVFRLIMSGEISLLTLNMQILDFLRRESGIDAEIKFTDVYEKKPDGCYDFREQKPATGYGKILCPHYLQTFADRMPFVLEMGVLDLLFNLGPGAGDYLRSCTTV